MGVAKEKVVESGCCLRESQTVQSNRSTDHHGKKKGAPSYFAFAVSTSKPYIYNALDVSSSKIELIW